MLTHVALIRLLWPAHIAMGRGGAANHEALASLLEATTDTKVQIGTDEAGLNSKIVDDDQARQLLSGLVGMVGGLVKVIGTLDERVAELTEQNQAFAATHAALHGRVDGLDATVAESSAVALLAAEQATAAAEQAAAVAARGKDGSTAARNTAADAADAAGVSSSGRCRRQSSREGIVRSQQSLVEARKQADRRLAALEVARSRDHVARQDRVS